MLDIILFIFSRPALWWPRKYERGIESYWGNTARGMNLVVNLAVIVVGTVGAYSIGLREARASYQCWFNHTSPDSHVDLYMLISWRHHQRSRHRRKAIFCRQNGKGGEEVIYPYDVIVACGFDNDLALTFFTSKLQILEFSLFLAKWGCFKWNLQGLFL